MDFENQFDKDICCENCREDCRGNSNVVLERGFIKYLIDKVIYERNKMNNNNNNNSSEQNNDADIDFAITQMKKLIENVKKLRATNQDIFNTSKIRVLFFWSSTATHSKHGRKEPFSMLMTLCYGIKNATEKIGES